MSDRPVFNVESGTGHGDKKTCLLVASVTHTLPLCGSEKKPVPLSFDDDFRISEAYEQLSVLSHSLRVRSLVCTGRLVARLGYPSSGSETLFIHNDDFMPVRGHRQMFLDSLTEESIREHAIKVTTKETVFLLSRDIACPISDWTESNALSKEAVTVEFYGTMFGSKSEAYICNLKLHVSIILEADLKTTGLYADPAVIKFVTSRCAKTSSHEQKLDALYRDGSDWVITSLHKHT